MKKEDGCPLIHYFVNSNAALKSSNALAAASSGVAKPSQTERYNVYAGVQKLAISGILGIASEN